MYLPTQISFLIWGEHIAGRESKYTNFLSEQNSLSPEGNKNLNFRLSRDKVVHCETAANVSASLRKQNNFLVIFELGGITKHFWKQWELLYLDPQWKQNSLFPLESVSRLIYQHCQVSVLELSVSESKHH